MQFKRTVFSALASRGAVNWIVKPISPVNLSAEEQSAFCWISNEDVTLCLHLLQPEVSKCLIIDANEPLDNSNDNKGVLSM